MASHNQFSPTPNIVEGRQPNFEMALRIVIVMAEANERLFKVQSEAANLAFAENSKHLKALQNSLNTKDSGALLAEWTNLYQANMRRVLDVTRSCFEIVPQTQAEIANSWANPSRLPTRKRRNTSTSLRRRLATVAMRPQLR